jgi:hypothetical protein
MAGVRPRDLPRRPLEAAIGQPQELPVKVHLYHYLYLIALDSQELPAAAHYLQACRERVGQLATAQQGSIWFESAFFAAAYQRDLTAAQAFFDQA